MLVVSDSTPLNVLIRTDLVGILPRLYQIVFIPPAVREELSHPRTPKLVQDWILSAPSWLYVRMPMLIEESISPDRGEREAICLAKELQADLLLVDDKRARQTALHLGLCIIGTLGILELAAQRKLIDLGQALDRIRQTDFFISPELIEAILARHHDENK